MELCKTFTIEYFKGTHSFEVDVYADYYEGGSNRWGSDEPEWVECTVKEIYKAGTCKRVSERLYSALEKEFGDWFEDLLIEEKTYG